MPQTGYCTDLTCNKELTELYECHCCSWLICLKHLLEHVEISKRDKIIQLDSVKNELISNSYTLEFIVEKKLQDIECEKKLINQAKIILEKSESTIEEIQMISNEITKVILSNRKEETIVKVEPSLSDIKIYSYDNEITTLPNLFVSSSSNEILQQPISPMYRSVRARMNMSKNLIENSSTPKRNDQSIKVYNGFSISSDSNDENIDPNTVNDEEVINKRKLTAIHCPLTFDGAFGFTKEKHSIEFCSVKHTFRRNLMGHFTLKHNIKKTYARQLYQAIQYGKDPKTTKLFNEDEDVMDRDRRISCPFSNKMVHLIGCCPTQSKNIPCQMKSVGSYRLMYHLKATHGLTHDVAKRIVKIYKEKLSKVNSSNDNDNDNDTLLSH